MSLQVATKQQPRAAMAMPKKLKFGTPEDNQLATFDVNDAIAKLKAVQNFTQIPAVIPDELSTNRPLMHIRVTEAYGKDDWARISGIVVDPTGEYKESQQVRNHLDKIVGSVDKEANELTVHIGTVESYETDAAHWMAQGVLAKDPTNGATFIKYKVGDRVSFSTELPVGAVQTHSILVIGISATRYCAKVGDKLDKNGTARHGVSIKIKQFDVVEPPNIPLVLDMFWKHPETFSLPWPTVEKIIADSNYKHSRVTGNTKEPKDKADTILFLPVLASMEECVRVFGVDKGAVVSFQFGEKGFFYGGKKKSDPTTHRYLRAKVKIAVWQSKEQLMGFPRTLPEFIEYVCELVAWESSLGFAKITSVAAWKLFGPLFMNNIRMVLPCQVNLYPTAENSLNSPDKEDPTKSFYDLTAREPIVDFVGAIMDDNLGIRVSLPWVTRQVSLNKLADLIVPDNGEAKVNQQLSTDKNLFLLNEWEATSLNLFLTSTAVSKYAFFAVISKQLSNPQKKRFAILNEWAAATGDQGTLGETVLWADWDSNPQEFLKATYGSADLVKIADDYPLLGENSTQTVMGADDVILVYAIDIGRRAKIVNQVYAEKTLAIEAPPPQQTSPKRSADAMANADESQPPAKLPKVEAPVDDDDEPKGDDNEESIDEDEMHEASAAMYDGYDDLE